MHYTLYHRLLSPNVSATMWWLIQTCRHQPIEFIFVRDSDGNPVCRHQSSLWILAHTAATSPYQQSQKLRTASISLPPADPYAHTPSPLQSHQNAHTPHLQWNSASCLYLKCIGMHVHCTCNTCLYLLFDVCISVSFATEENHCMVAETFVDTKLWLVQQLNL